MSRFANLSERLSADLPDPTRPYDEEDETTADHEEGKKKKEKPMADDTITVEQRDKDVAAATAAATQAANARYEAVMASEHYKGREAAAARLLKNGALSAEEITATLADLPAHTATAPQVDTEASEEAARKTMLAEMAKQGNSNLEDGDKPKPDARAEADARWAKARPLPEKGVK